MNEPSPKVIRRSTRRIRCREWSWMGLALGILTAACGSEPIFDDAGTADPARDAATTLDAAERPTSTDGSVGACRDDETRCGAACVDTARSILHCGACDSRCPAPTNASPTCDDGACSGRCAPGFGDCDSELANGCERSLASDPEHCGACGRACPGGPGVAAACVDGACALACAAGSADCNETTSDGCEIDVASDAENCGACGHVCPADSPCVEGACRPASVWARGLGGADFEQGVRIAADGLGNVYVAGVFGGMTDLGGGPLASAGLFDLFLASYDATGAHRWSRRFGGGASDHVRDLVLDDAGTLHLAGQYADGAETVYVASFDPATGAELWSRRCSGDASCAGNGVAADGAGNVYVTGSFRGTVDFGEGAVNVDSTQGYVASYVGASGAHRWFRALPAGGDDVTFGGSHAYVVGEYAYGADFGGVMLPGSAGFLASYAGSDGAFEWAAPVGNASITIRRAAADVAGNVYLTGSFRGTIDLGGGSVASEADSEDMFVASYDAAGAYRWERTTISNGDEIGFDLTLDDAGALYVTGTFDGTVDFGGGDLSACCPRFGVWHQDAFLVSYETASGSYRWARHYGGLESDGGYGLDAAGERLYLTGSFRRTATFGGAAISSVGDRDAFIAVFDR